MTELIDEAEKIEAGQHNEFWIPAHLDLHLRPHFAPKSLNSPHHTLHWISSIGVASTNRFVVFCSTLNNENGEYSNRWPRQSNVSRPQTSSCGLGSNSVEERLRKRLRDEDLNLCEAGGTQQPIFCPFRHICPKG